MSSSYRDPYYRHKFHYDDDDYYYQTVPSRRRSAYYQETQPRMKRSMSTGTISNDYDYHHRQDFYDHYQQVTTY
jgi:hypothetical protein